MPRAESGRDASGYADLDRYAAIGDGRTVALIATDGRIDWLPLPRLDTPPVFAAILDADRGGSVSLQPTEPFETSRAYVEGTNVLVTEFRTASGIARVTDALVTGVAGQLPWTELARRVDGIDGSVRFAWSVRPGGVLGSDGVRRVDTVHGPLLRVGAIDLVLTGFGHGRTDPHAPSDGFPDGPFEFRGAFETSPDSRHLLVLCGTEDEPIHLPDPGNVDRGIDRTIETWQRWSREFSYEGDWAPAVRRSALALKLLIQQRTGAIAAAATTGLPERRAGGKNWDYRFAWVRDLSYTVAALIRYGLREETHAAMSWMLGSLKQYGSDVPVLLRLDGSLADGAHETDAHGWRGVAPVVVGNPAADQLQLGVYADMLGVMRQYVAAGNILDEHTSELLVEYTNQVCRGWDRADSGMWELPQTEHYTSSKMGAWQAITDAVHLAQLGELRPHADDLVLWRRNIALLEQWLDEQGWSPTRGAYVMHPGSDRLDASVLLHAGQPFGPPDRMSATIAAIERELADGDAHVRRYTSVDDDGAFVACGFWLVRALAETGRVADARTRMDALVATANDVGLFAELIDGGSGIDGESGAFLGNLPQGLSHLALIQAATAIADAS